jgi:hypothetical protein
MDTSYDVVDRVASATKRRPKTVNMRYPGMGVFTRSATRTLGGGVRIEFSAGDHYLLSVCRHDVEDAFSFGAPIRAPITTDMLVERVGGVGVYRPLAQRGTRLSPAARRALEGLQLAGDELVVCAKNRVSLFSRCRLGADEEISRACLLPLLSEGLRPERRVEAVLPKLFADLEVYVQWAISDDVEREERMTSAARSELCELVAAVCPKMEQINAFLDQSDQEREASAALGALAQTPLEAQEHLLRHDAR